MTSEAETTAHRIDVLMQRHHFKRADLAREFGVSSSAVTQKFKSDRFTLRDVCRVADIFDVSVDWLLGRDGGDVDVIR